MITPITVNGTAAEGIARLCEDERLRSRMGEAARKKITHNYDARRVTDSLLRTYEAVLVGVKELPVEGVTPSIDELHAWPAELEQREADLLGHPPVRPLTGRLGDHWQDSLWLVGDSWELAHRFLQ